MAVGNLVYSLEGWPSSPGVNNVARVFNGAAGIWRADLAAPPFTGQVVSTDNALRTQGAWDGGYWYVLGPDSKLYRYNPTTDLWSAALVGGAAILVGGTLEDHPYWMCSDGRFVYIMDTPARDNSTGNTFRKYDPQADTLTTLTGMPGAEQGFAGRNLLLWDGADGIYANHGDGAAQFYKYSITGNSWSTITAASGALSTMVSGANTLWGGFLQGKLWVLGLQGGNAQAFVYNPASPGWTTKATFATGNTITGVSPFGDIDDNRIWIASRDPNSGSLLYDVGANSWFSGHFSPASFNQQGQNHAVARYIAPAATWYQANGTTPLDLTQFLGGVSVGQTQTYHAVVKLAADRPGGVTIAVVTDIAQDAEESVTVCATSGGVFAASFATGAVTAGQAVDVFLKNVPTVLQTQGVGKTFQLQVS